jgi:hypothetical protein
VGTRELVGKVSMLEYFKDLENGYSIYDMFSNCTSQLRFVVHRFFRLLSQTPA